MAYTIHAFANRGTDNGIIAYISASTAAALPTAEEIAAVEGGYHMISGSICMIRQTGVFYILDGTTWYNADGSGAFSRSQDAMRSAEEPAADEPQPAEDEMR